MNRPTLRELFSAFLRTGLTSFGMSILQNLKAMILRRGFVTESEIQEGLALVQLYPGPIMVDLVAFIGYRSRGVAGALVAALGFLLPATAMMLAAAAAYVRYGSLPGVGTMLLGLDALVVGVVLNITLDFARRNVGGVMEAALALAAFALGLMHVNLVWGILGGLLVGAVIWNKHDSVQPEGRQLSVRWANLGVPLLLGVGLVGLAAWSALHPSPVSLLTLVFMKIGAVAFGNGVTILPVMEQDVVGAHHWLTPSQFSAAVGLGQITPGPILNSATFVGYLVAGLLGALAATFAIFAPSIVMTLVFTELFTHIRHLGPVRGAIRGVMAVFVGMLAGVVLTLGRGALVQPVSFIFAAGALVGLRYFRWDTLIVFGGGLALWGGLVYFGWMRI